MVQIDGIIFSIQQYGGISSYFLNLISFLSRNKIDAILSLDDLARVNLLAIKNTLLVYNANSRLLERYLSCRLSNKSLIFHSSYYRLPEKRNIPTVLTLHDFVYERYAKGMRRWIHSTQKKAAIRAAQVVICVSEATRQDFLEFIGETPGQTVCVIHNGVSEVFRPLSLKQVSVPYVLYVGQRGGYKNFMLALQSMVFLPDIELHCVGGGVLHAKELLGLPESVISRVKHLGFVNDDELNALYNNAVCLLYPSSYEGFGIPVVEAMRAGCPVVSVNCKAVVEAGGDALIVVTALDARCVADAILKTVSSERQYIIEKGFVVANKYSWETTHRQTLDVYRSMGA